MADGGPPAPQPPPVIPPVVPPVPPVQLPAPPAQVLVPPTQAIQPAPMPQLNWSHLSLNLQVNQTKMQKHVFLGLING